MITEMTKKYLENKYSDVPGVELRRMDEEFCAELKILERALSSNEITHEQSQRMAEIIDTLEYLNLPTSSPAGLGQPNTGEHRARNFSNDEERHLEFGTWLQAVACAGSESGSTIGQFRTGEINRNILAPETRSEGLESSTPSLGGFIVQKEFAEGIFTKIYKTNDILNRCRQIRISSNANGLKIPFNDETSRADGSRSGGALGYWIAEGNEKTASKPKFGLMELSLKKVCAIVYSTDSLLQDAAALGQFVETAIIDELNFKILDAIVNGDGAGKPIGYLQANCLISVSKESGQVATTLIYENILSIISRFWASSRANAIWTANVDIIPQLYAMSLEIGTAGAAIYSPANGASGNFDRLFGHPIIYIEQAPTLGTAGDLTLCDFSQYVLVTKPLTAAWSPHVRWIYDESCFRAVARVDGQPMWNSALTPYKGNDTQSCFVTTETRS